MWTDTNPMNCNGCHLAPPANHAHGTCTTCHAEPNATGTALRPGAFHLSGSIDLGNGNGNGTCTACHGTPGDAEPWPSTGSHAAHRAPMGGAPVACLSCHVVGWAPQRFEPFEGGFAGMKATPHLAHQGCENCHGPAAAHAAVERGDVRASVTERDRLRAEVTLKLDTPEARQRVVNNCLECHDLDNSPQFDFDTYWPQVEHSQKKPVGSD